MKAFGIINSFSIFNLQFKNMNSKHRDIIFTFETKDSNNFSFLDAKLPAKANTLLLQFFEKPQLLEFLLIKIVLFLILKSRFSSTSFCSAFYIEVEHLRSIFKCNNYPVNIIDQCTKKRLDKLYVP